MRRNRTKTKKRSKNEYLTIILFVVLLFVGAPTIGYFGTKYFLIPKYFNTQESSTTNDVAASRQKLAEKIEEKVEEKAITSNNEEKTNEIKEKSSEEKKYTFEIPALSIYSIQVGSFDNKEHAQNLIKDLNNKGLAGYIVESDRFRVVAMSFTERSKAEKYRDIIKNHYSDAFISPKQLATRSIKYGEQGKEYSEAAAKALDGLMKYYDSFSDYIYQKDILNENSNEIIQFVDSEINRLEEITKLIASENPSEDFTNLNDQLTDIVENAKIKLKQVKEANVSDREKILEIFMESINSYENIM